MEQSVEASETPMGFCKKCRQMPLMKMNGKPRCPKCDVEAEEPSNRVVNVTVTDDDFKLVINTLGYAEKVTVDDPRPPATPTQIAAAQLLMVKEGRPTLTPRKPPETPLPEPPLTTLSDVSKDGLLTLSHDLLIDWLNASHLTSYDLRLDGDQLDDLYGFIDTLPTPKSMKDARVLIKLQDRISELLQ
jgi:hypothetical protein